MNSRFLRYWLAAMYLPEIGPRRMKRWLLQFESIESFFLAKDEALHAANLTLKQIAAVRQPDWKSVDRDLIWAEDANHHLITLADDDYPALLKEIPDPPLVLFVKGNKSLLKAMQLAMVGSRHASRSGLETAEQFAYHLAQSGLVITSGLALGIDGASHRGALNANGGTIGVAGTGLNQLYPPANRKLAAEMIERNGAVISEFPLNTPPRAQHFPRRNRIISGLSVGVLVVEAALKSGSMITVKHALEQGREVFAIPGAIHNPLARGCHHLIRQGATLVETAKDIMDELGAFERFLQSEKEQPKSVVAESIFPPRPEGWQLIEHIGHEITPIDMIILRSGLTAGEVSSILLKLELHGYIQSVTGGYIRATPN